MQKSIYFILNKQVEIPVTWETVSNHVMQLHSYQSRVTHLIQRCTNLLLT